MTYLLLKSLHLLSVCLFFGAGICSVFVKLRADQSGDPQAIVFAHRTLVLADWLFTVPSGIALPVTGLWMVYLAGHDWRGGWVLWGIALYLLAGLCWLPAWWLQFRMRDAAEAALRDGTPLPPEHRRWTLIWALLGVPAFLASVAAVWVMTAKTMFLG